MMNHIVTRLAQLEIFFWFWTACRERIVIHSKLANWILYRSCDRISCSELSHGSQPGNFMQVSVSELLVLHQIQVLLAMFCSHFRFKTTWLCERPSLNKWIPASIVRPPSNQFNRVLGWDEIANQGQKLLIIQWILELVLLILTFNSYGNLHKIKEVGDFTIKQMAIHNILSEVELYEVLHQSGAHHEHDINTDGAGL